MSDTQENAVLVERDGKVVEVAKRYFEKIHRGAFDNPRLRLRIEDGMKFLAETSERFDVIALDLPDPIGPATELYEEAFFRDCKRALAAGGVRFTQFYNNARCCPTRATLLTGLYPHQAGVGHMMEDHGTDAYRGDLTRRSVTIAEALRPAGYRNYAVGKWHVTPLTQSGPTGPYDGWPLGRGFDLQGAFLQGALQHDAQFLEVDGGHEELLGAQFRGLEPHLAGARLDDPAEGGVFVVQGRRRSRHDEKRGRGARAAAVRRLRPHRLRRRGSDPRRGAGVCRRCAHSRRPEGRHVAGPPRVPPRSNRGRRTTAAARGEWTCSEGYGTSGRWARRHSAMTSRYTG